MPEDTRPRSADQLPGNHVVSLNPHYTVDAFDQALDQISSVGAAERVKLLRQFAQNQRVQVVVYDQSQPRSAHLNQVRQGLEYQPEWTNTDLLQRSIPSSKEVLGFTRPDINHVVISVEAQKTPFRLSGADMQRAMDRTFKAAIEYEDGDDLPWSISDVAPNKETAEFITYLHEMGHQIHYSVNKPLFPEEVGSLNDYGASNSREWFAEHFVAWTLDAQGYAQLDPAGARFIEENVRLAASKPKQLTTKQ